MKTIPLCEPYLKGNEGKFLQQCINTNWLSESGKYVSLFEKKIAKFTKSKYSVGLINGTSALHLALKVIGCKTNEEIIVPTLTFIAPINSVLYNNCIPVFMDCDNFFNIDSEKCINFLQKETYFKNGKTYNKKTKRIIKAIIIVHVWGNAANIEDLVSICRKLNIKIVEDASESLGTRYIKGKFKGIHTGLIGDIGCLSFNTNKIITCGSGGMIITNNKKHSAELKYLSTQAKDNNIYYIHNNIGYNYRLNNLNAAVGLAQLEKIKEILEKKKLINKYYITNIQNKIGLNIYESPTYSFNNNWMNILLIDKNYKLNRDDIIKKFIKKNVDVRPVWKLNNTQKKFRKFQTYKISNAYKLIKNSLCLPSSTGISPYQLSKIISIL